MFRSRAVVFLVGALFTFGACTSSATPVPTATPTAVVTPTPTPAPSATPSPSPTPSPTATPSPSPSPIPLTGQPGPCLFLEARYCAEAKIVTLTDGGLEDTYAVFTVPAGTTLFAPGSGTITVRDDTVFSHGKSVTPHLILRITAGRNGWNASMWSIWGAHGTVKTKVASGAAITKTTGASIPDQPAYTLMIEGYPDQNSPAFQPGPATDQQIALLNAVFAAP
jgi:hypothetical protein